LVAVAISARIRYSPSSTLENSIQGQ